MQYFLREVQVTHPGKLWTKRKKIAVSHLSWEKEVTGCEGTPRERAFQSETPSETLRSEKPGAPPLALGCAWHILSVSKNCPQIKSRLKAGFGALYWFFCFFFFLLPCERVSWCAASLPCPWHKKVTSLKPHFRESGSPRAGWAAVNPRCSTTCLCYRRRKDLAFYPVDMSDMVALRVRNGRGARKGNPGHRAAPGEGSSPTSRDQ